jgi:hypothetical protein
MKKYDGNHKSWLFGDGAKTPLVFYVSRYEAVDEIGVHILNRDIKSQEFNDALKSAMRTSSKAIFIHSKSIAPIPLWNKNVKKA